MLARYISLQSHSYKMAAVEGEGVRNVPFANEKAEIRNVPFGSDAFLGEFKLSMWIPTELGGKVIGLKGIIISNIETETKCKMIRALKPVGQSLWNAVVILGEAMRCQAAYNEVARIVNNGNYSVTFYAGSHVTFCSKCYRSGWAHPFHRC